MSICFPVMVKPIDSSESKGISKVEKVEGFEEAYKIAFDNSRGKKIWKVYCAGPWS